MLPRVTCVTIKMHNSLERAYYSENGDMLSALINNISDSKMFMHCCDRMHTCLAQGEEGCSTYRQVLAGSIGRSPDIEVQAILILTAVRSVANCLRAGRSVCSCIHNLSWLERALGNRSLPSTTLSQS